MKVLIAPDSFKGSLSAAEAAEAIARGLRSVISDIQVDLLPLADGGEGTLDCVLAAGAGERVIVEVTGPLGAPCEAALGLLDSGQTALVELAQAAGLTLIPKELRDPCRTTSFGVGELILAGLERGATNVLVTLGGSAVNDAGTGALTALGARFLDDSGVELGCGGSELARLAAIDMADLDPRLAHTRLTIACDVDNPLTGAHGASLVFSRQKGASSEDAQALDRALSRFAEIARRACGRDVATIAGSGAAGGFAAAFLAFTNAQLRRGFNVVADALQLDARLEGADLVVTGEGCVDAQTLRGKAPFALASRAAKRGIPVVAFCGRLGEGWQGVLDCGVAKVIPLAGESVEESYAVANAARMLAESARNYLLTRID